MKKIALILILPLVLLLAGVAAQKKDSSKKLTESATSEQDAFDRILQMRGCASRVTARGETGGAG